MTENQILKYVGWWWLPDAPNVRHSGTFVARTDGLSTVELTSGGFSTRRYGEEVGAVLLAVRRVRNFEMVHGEVDGQPVTLLGVRPARTQLRNFTDEIFSQELQAERVLIGTHLPSPSADVFHEAIIEFDFLRYWAQMGGVRYSSDRGPGGTELRTRGELVSVPHLSVGLNGVELTLAQTLGTFSEREVGPNELSLSGRLSAKLSVSSQAALPLDGIMGYVNRFQSLLQLAMDAPCAIREVRLKSVDPEGEQTYSEYCQWYAYAADSGRSSHETMRNCFGLAATVSPSSRWLLVGSSGIHVLRLQCQR